MENTMIDKLGGRKMILGTLGLLTLALMSALKPGSVTTEFVAGLLGIIAAFNVSNVTTTLKTIGQNGPLPTSNEPPPTGSGINDETKVALMNVQQQLDQSNQRIEQMVDIIQRTVLTKAKPVDNLSVQPTTGQTNASTNRQAIGEYLSTNFG